MGIPKLTSCMYMRFVTKRSDSTSGSRRKAVTQNDYDFIISCAGSHFVENTIVILKSSLLSLVKKLLILFSLILVNSFISSQGPH